MSTRDGLRRLLGVVCLLGLAAATGGCDWQQGTFPTDPGGALISQSPKLRVDYKVYFCPGEQVTPSEESTGGDVQAEVADDLIWTSPGTAPARPSRSSRSGESV